jgi:hypothetical protein
MFLKEITVAIAKVASVQWIRERAEKTNVMEKVAMSGHNWAFRVIISKTIRSAHAICVNAVLRNLRTAS